MPQCIGEYLCPEIIPMKKFILVILAIICAVVTVGAQPRFTYDDIADGKFRAKSVGGLRSMADGNHYTTFEDGCIYRHAYNGREQKSLILDVKSVGIEGRIGDYTFSPDESKILLRLDSEPLYRRSHFSRYVVYDLASGTVESVDESGRLRWVEFAPNGKKVAFVKDNNLYIRDLECRFTYPVTEDGEWNHIINAMPIGCMRRSGALTMPLSGRPMVSKLFSSKATRVG